MAELRPFTIQDESARYRSRRLSWLSSLIGYGLIVACMIIFNQVNVQIGALANHHYALCMTVWALHSGSFVIKRDYPAFAQLRGAFAGLFSLFIRAFCAGVAPWASAYFIVLFFFSLFDPGNSLKFMMGATRAQPGDYWYRSVCFRYVFRWLAKTITLRHILSVTIRSCKTVEWLTVGGAENGAYSDSLRGGNVAVERMGLFDFWNWAKRRGAETVDILIRIALILFFSAVGWTVLASLIGNRLASDIRGRLLPGARIAYPAYAVS